MTLSKYIVTLSLAVLCAGCLVGDTLSSSVRLHHIARHVASSGASDAPEVVYGRTLTSGYADDQADRIGRYAGEVSTSTPVAFNLVTGMADKFGQVATFTSVKAFTVVNLSQVSDIGVTGSLGSFTVGADGMACMSAPLGGLSVGTVTVSLETGTPASFTVLFIGASQ